jgi:hypothetical protein
LNSYMEPSLSVFLPSRPAAILNIASFSHPQLPLSPDSSSLALLLQVGFSLADASQLPMADGAMVGVRLPNAAQLGPKQDSVDHLKNHSCTNGVCRQIFFMCYTTTGQGVHPQHGRLIQPWSICEHICTNNFVAFLAVADHGSRQISLYYSNTASYPPDI